MTGAITPASAPAVVSVRTRSVAVPRDADAASGKIAGRRRRAAVSNLQHAHERGADHVSTRSDAHQSIAELEESRLGNGVDVDYRKRPLDGIDDDLLPNGRRRHRLARLKRFRTGETGRRAVPIERRSALANDDGQRSVRGDAGGLDLREERQQRCARATRLCLGGPNCRWSRDDPHRRSLCRSVRRARHRLLTAAVFARSRPPMFRETPICRSSQGTAPAGPFLLQRRSRAKDCLMRRAVRPEDNWTRRWKPR
jgi:hypothetical protein